MSNATLLELQLINAAIDSADPNFFVRTGLSRDWFATYRPAYDFIEQHIRDHASLPTLSTVVGAIEMVEYVEYESPDILRRKLGDALAKRELGDWLKSIDTSKPFASVKDAIDRKSAEIEAKYSIRQTDGIDVMRSGSLVFEEYDLRRNGQVGVKIPTPFVTLNNALGGGMETGDEVVIIAFTNRGKSWLGALFGETANQHGFKVVHASLEMSAARVLFRWHSLRSYRQYGRGFSNRQLLAGQLPLDDEQKFIAYISQFDAHNPDANYILKTRSDYKRGVTLDAIERDIIENDLAGGIYILDQLNLCEYHSLSGGMREFHRKLVGIFAKYNVVGLVLTQSNGDSEKRKRKDDDGMRILQAPDLTAYSDSIAVIQDARTILAFDSLDTKAMISLEKGTDGGVGTQVDLYWHPDRGEIAEMTDAIQRQLDAVNAVKLF